MSLFFLVFVLSTAACSGDNDGGSCTVTDNGDGSKTISCDDGTSVTVNDGQNGNDGQDGRTTLVLNVVLEQGDSHCPTGGIAVMTGIDSDANGLLEGGEIASTSYLCNGQDTTPPTGILQGSYTIHNNLDAYLISAITEITGDLIVEAPGLTSLDLTALTSIGGDLKIQTTDLTSLALPALTSVGGGAYTSTTTPS